MAYEIGYDIIINDDEIEMIKGEIIARAETFEENVKTLNEIVERIVAEGIKKGEISNKLSRFSGEVSNLTTHLRDIAKEVTTQSDNFLQDIDTADSCLF